MIANYLLLKPDKSESLKKLINLFGTKQINQALVSQIIEISKKAKITLTSK